MRDFRIFFVDGEPLYSSVYREEGDYGSENAPKVTFAGIAKGDRYHKTLNPASCWRFFIETCLRRYDQLKWAHEQARGDNI